MPESVLNEVAGVRTTALLKKTLTQGFLVNFAEFLKTPF